MVYFINLFASIGFSLQFFKSYTDYSNTELLNRWKQKEMRKLYQRYNFPYEEYERTKHITEALERKIKSNVLINL
jgi:hypothetical protein